MLLALTVKEFILIERMSLALGEGMTVFTGETGAGKSVLMGALAAVFGQRASSGWVRHGAKQAEVIAELSLDDARLDALLAEHDVDMDGDERLILRRVIMADGRSKAYVNGMPFPVKLLQQVGAVCLDMHGQHEHQALFDAEYHRQIVDAYVPGAQLQACEMAYQAWKQAQAQLQKFQQQQQNNSQQEDWMRASLRALDALDLAPDMLDTLEASVNRHRHAQHIQEAAALALQCVDGDEVSVRSLLARASHDVEAMAEHHPGLAAAYDLLQQMDAMLGELEPALRDAGDMEVDHEQAMADEERLAALHDMMRRHHTDVQGLLALQQQWQSQLSDLETASWDESGLQQRCELTAADYRQAALVVSESRGEASESLVMSLRPFLDQLALQGMQVVIEVQPHVEDSSAWSAQGWDEVIFMASSNPGEPFRPLAAIASGGELSRFVLALKGCGALENLPGISVFDEVDVGIGGETAWCVGQLLAAMAEARQVLVVSHLPQVAACAQHQVYIHKHVVDDGRTVTRLDALDADSRVVEIARMLGGENAQSLEHAKHMLQRGALSVAS